MEFCLKTRVLYAKEGIVKLTLRAVKPNEFSCIGQGCNSLRLSERVCSLYRTWFKWKYDNNNPRMRSDSGAFTPFQQDISPADILRMNSYSFLQI